MFQSLKSAIHKSNSSSAVKPHKFNGLYMVSDGQLTKKANILDTSYEVNIIAIHGLGGHAYDTWTDQKTKTFWLKDILPDDIPGARIFTYGFPSHGAWSGSLGTLSDYATTMNAHISSMRHREQGKPRKIIFVAHSLGGIVLKRALFMAKLDKDYRDIFEDTAGILFFGTPHMGKGASETDVILGAMLDQILQATGLSRLIGKTRAEYHASLTAGSSYIREKNYDFSLISTKINIVNIYETKGEAGVGRLVRDSFSPLTAAQDALNSRYNANYMLYLGSRR